MVEREKNMENKNYIVINGKKAELTKEQLKQLGIEVEKPNPYERRQEGTYYYFTDTGKVILMDECNQYGTEFHKNQYESGNYCASIKMTYQDMLHDLLNRKLRQFSNLNGGIELNSDINKSLWIDDKIIKYYLYYDVSRDLIEIEYSMLFKRQGTIYFKTRKIAEHAIEEIVKPFMKEHKEFVW